MKNQYTNKNTDALVRNLIALSFSVDEARIYSTVLNNGSLTTSKIAKIIGVLPSAVYRLTKKLDEKGFIKTLETYPSTFQAVPHSIAVDSYITKTQKELEGMRVNKEAASLEIPSQSPTRVDLLLSQKTFFEKFVELTNQAKVEVLTISIGEPVPDEIKIACVRARERGVSIKFIFHVHNNENDALLKSWVKMGMEVKHYKDSGYHLTIADGRVAVLVANNPENTAERIGMAYYNERLASSLRDYFYQIWERSDYVSL